MYDKEVPGHYILNVYDTNKNIIEKYSFYSPRFILYDNFDAENPGGIIEMDSGKATIYIRYKENIGAIGIKHELGEILFEELEGYPINNYFSCGRTCYLENEDVKLARGEEWCIGFIPATQKDGYVCVNCGDGICSEFEDEYSCYKDCQKCEGDANNDIQVNILDLIYIRGKLNLDCSVSNCEGADVNKDGRTNILDLIYVREKLNTDCTFGIQMSPMQNQWWKALVALIIIGAIISSDNFLYSFFVYFLW